MNVSAVVTSDWAGEHRATDGQHFGLTGPESSAAHLCPLCRPGQDRRYRVDDCSFCIANPSEGPSHDASSKCESGKHSHCSCGTCF